MVQTIDDVVALAQALARNCGYAVFPCSEDKRPTLKGWPERASNKADAIAKMWRERPGPLIGVATGRGSGASVLDVDRKHPPAHDWWAEHCDRLLPTRCYQSRNGGIHLVYEDILGLIRNSEGSRNGLPAGCDTRGCGGFVVFWFAAGCECLDHGPPAPWPKWLRETLQSHRQRPEPEPAPIASADPDRVLAGLLRTVADAKEGTRNSSLYWAACRAAEKGFGADAFRLLRDAALGTGLDAPSIIKTIVSAQRSIRGAA